MRERADVDVGDDVYVRLVLELRAQTAAEGHLVAARVPVLAALRPELELPAPRLVEEFNNFLTLARDQL